MDAKKILLGSPIDRMARDVYDAGLASMGQEPLDDAEWQGPDRDVALVEFSRARELLCPGEAAPTIGQPIFVVIEGIDRSGKSLQGDLLTARMHRAGMTACGFTTPYYDSELGQLITMHLTRKVSMRFAGHDSAFDALALQCELVCNRYHVADRIRKSLQAGTSAVCVRWWQSALLYGTEDGVEPDFIRATCSGLPEPDLHALLRVPPQSIERRLNPANRYESDLPRQRRLSDAYESLWRSEAEQSPSGSRRWAVVEGDGTPEEVSERVWQAVLQARPDLAGRKK